MIDTTDAWLRLATLRTLGAANCRDLISAAGGVRELVSSKPAWLRAQGLSDDDLQRLAEPTHTLKITREWLNTDQHRLLGISDPSYPPGLAAMADAPLLLYVDGDVDCLNHPSLAIVGSRKPTRDGEEIARQFAADFARQGLGIVSGLALGIDAAAHTGALAANGMTVAVVGLGIDRVYPAANQALARQIAAEGALVSEFPLGSEPRRHHFPARNRIIAGLSLGVLVVEAALRSGSLITARLAAELGLEVFACPGSIHNPMARGCHRLIREGAKLTENSADVFNEISTLLGERLHSVANLPAVTATVRESPDPRYTDLLENMGYGPVSADSLSERTGLTIAEVSSMLLILELEGFVEALPDRRYARLGRER